jgi:trimeric autotransporter adhesin
MSGYSIRVLLLSVIVCSSAVAFSQQRAGEIPRVIRYSGTVKGLDGSPRTGTVGVAFAIYADEKTAVPLWQEVQNVIVDETGHYSVLLGAARGEGLPDALFATNEARWLGIRVESEQEQPRVLLAAVPYALKAGDAETLGGKPLSSFVLNSAGGSSGSTGNGTSSASTTSLGTLLPSSINTAGSTGTQNFVAKWTDNAGTLGNSVIQDTGTQVGIGKLPSFATLDVAGGGAFTGQLRVMGANAPTTGAGLEEYYDGGAGHIFAYDRDLNVEHDLSFGTNNEVYIKNSTLGVAKIPSLATLDVAGSGSFVGPVTFNGTNGIINTTNGNLVLQVGGTPVFYADGGNGNAVVAAGHNLVVANGNIGATGTVTGTLFSGSGASLTSLPAANLTGAVPNTAISGTYSNAVSFSNVGNSFAGNGVGLSNVNAVSVGGVASSALNLRLITYLGGCDSCSVLTAADNQKLIYQNLLGAPVTLLSITCYSDAGTPSVDIQRDSGGTLANVTASPIGCSTTPTAATSFSLATLNANDKVNFLMTTPDAVAHRVTIIIKVTL